MISLIILISALFIEQEDYKSVDYIKYQKALEIISSIEDNNYQYIDSLNINFSGQFHYLGHYPSPRQRKSYDIQGSLSWSKTKANSLINLIEEQDTITRKEVITNTNISVWDYGETTPQSNINIEAYTMFYSPISVYNEILQNKQTARYSGFDNKNNLEYITYYSEYSGSVSVGISKADKRIESVQILRYDNIEGDYYLQFKYLDYTKDQGFVIPQKVLVEEWNTLKYEFNCEYKDIVEKPLVKEAPIFEMDKIAENLYKISYPTGTHYSYIVDYGTYLGVIEAPTNEYQMQFLSNYINSKFPNKSIKYCFLTHHHPDHAGGFRYFYKNGATIVTTELSQTYQQELVNKNFTHQKDHLKYTKDGLFDTIKKDSKKDYSNSNLNMIAYEFSDNGHTTEFLLYYFPKSQILIIGDLYYINNSSIRGSARASKIYEFIKKNKLKVTSFYTTWMPKSARISNIEDVKESATIFENKKNQQ